MRVASKVICLVKDPHGFGPAIFDALHPSPSSNLTRVVSSFELPVAEKCSVSEEPEPVELAQFIAPDGSLQVSVLLLPNLKPPVAVCAVNELLALIVSDKYTKPPTIMFPCYIERQKITLEFKSSSVEQGVTLYGVAIGASTALTPAILAGVPKPPPALRIHCETVNCLVHLVQVFKLPTVLLVGTGTGYQNTSAADQELEALCELGGFLANFAGLSFIGDKVSLKEMEKSGGAQEPWQALYG